MKLVIYEEYDQGYARAYGRGITLMREDDVATLLEKMVYHEIHTHLDKQANAPSPDGAFEDAYWHEVDLKGIKISIEIDEVSIEGILE